MKNERTYGLKLVLPLVMVGLLLLQAFPIVSATTADDKSLGASESVKTKEVAIPMADFVALCNKAKVGYGSLPIDIDKLIGELSSKSALSKSNSRVTVSSTEDKVSFKLPDGMTVDKFLESALKSDEFKKRLATKDADVSIESLIADAICDTKSAFSGGSLNVSDTWSLEKIVGIIGKNFTVNDTNVTPGGTPTFDDAFLFEFMKAVLFNAGLPIKVNFPDGISDTLKGIASKCNTTKQEANQFIAGILNECSSTSAGSPKEWSTIYEEMKKFHYGQSAGLFCDGTEGSAVDFMQNVSTIDKKFLNNMFLSSTAFTNDEQLFTTILKEKAGSATGSSKVEVLISLIDSALTHADSKLRAQNYQTSDLTKAEVASKIKIEIPVVFADTDFTDKIVAPFTRDGDNLKWTTCPVELASPEFETYVNAVAKKCSESFATAAGTVESIKTKFIELFFSKEELDKFVAGIKTTGPIIKQSASPDATPSKKESGFLKKNWWWIALCSLGIPIAGLGLWITVSRRKNSEIQQEV